MKIGFISSYAERCGVADYCQNLAQGFIELGNEIKIAANYPKDQLFPDPEYVKRFFHVPFMTNETTADTNGIVEYLADRDVIHVQFEQSLYHPSYFIPLIQDLKNLGKRIVFTMHSAGFWKEMNPNLVDQFCVHEPLWCPNQIVVPMSVKFYDDINPTETFNKSITSFGLGRNDDNIVKEAIKGTDYQFNPTYGTNKWLSREELVCNIKKSQVIVLLYPDVAINVSSSAIAIAMGCDRPIIITNSRWFSHVINYPNLYVIEGFYYEGREETTKQLRFALDHLFDPAEQRYINNNKALMREIILETGRDYDSVLEQYLEIYEG